jgi:hypothetical protein
MYIPVKGRHGRTHGPSSYSTSVVDASATHVSMDERPGIAVFMMMMLAMMKVEVR